MPTSQSPSPKSSVTDPGSPATGEKGQGAQEENTAPVSSLKTVYVVETGETTLPEFDSESDAEKHAKAHVKATGLPVDVTTRKRVVVEEDDK